MTNWLTSFWATAGTGIIAGAIIVIWDILRIWVQSRWLVKKINQPVNCPHCRQLSKKIDKIHDQLGAKINDPGQPRSD